MIQELKAKVKSGRKLNKTQVAWFEANIGPYHGHDCDICAFNLINSLGMNKWLEKELAKVKTVY